MAASSGVRRDIRDQKTRVAISQMDKLELEDRHYRLMEENLALKKYSRSQEEKIKKMATKLLRLTSDDKREAKREGVFHNAVHHHGDLESELDDALSRNRDLEKHITSLKSKVMVLKQQLESHGKRHTPYDRIQSRISSGIKKKGQRSMSTEDISTDKKPAARDAATQSSVSCHNILEEVRRDNEDLEDQLLQLQQDVSALRAEKERTREQQKLRRAQFEIEKLQLQDELQSQITTLQREHGESELSLVKCRRELRDKNSRLDTLNNKFTSLERNNDLLKASHSRVLHEMEALSQQLKEERGRTSKVESQLHDSRLSQRTITELQGMVEELRGEKDRLREANDRLARRQDEVVSSIEGQSKDQLKTSQRRLKELESEHKRELREKAKLVDELAVERQLNESLDSEMQELRTTYLQLKEDYDQIKDKLSFFNKESSLDWSEVEEALVMVRHGKATGGGVISFLSEDKEQQEVSELRASLADTINELEKTRQLLQMQHTINKEYKSEVESTRDRRVEKEQEHSSQLQEYAQLLDIKAARIKKLEGELREIAYGTRQIKLDTGRFEYGGEEEVSVELERGQNLLQFQVGQVSLSSEAVSQLHTSSPGLFITLNFSDYEALVTPVKQGSRPHFGFTSNYVVTVDDSFLKHLQKSLLKLELNQGLGFKYQTLGVATVQCKELIAASSGGKVHGKVSLTGVDGLRECVCVGSVEYWMRFKHPVTQSLRLYQERSKAVAAIDEEPHTVTHLTPSHHHHPPEDPDFNELVISVNKAHGFDCQQSAESPSCYVMYKFYTFPDHDTRIVAHSSAPVFQDKHTFPLSMNQHLNHYLHTKSLEVYVFDDESTEEGYVGMTRLPLLELAEGQPITGTFQLHDMKEKAGGFLDISLRWKHVYHTPTPPLTVTQPHTLTTHTPLQVIQAPTTKSIENQSEPLEIGNLPSKQQLKNNSFPTEEQQKTAEPPLKKIEPTSRKQNDKKAPHVSVGETPAPSESESVSLPSASSPKVTKRVVKVSRSKVPPKGQSAKRSKGILRLSKTAGEDNKLLPSLKNSLPPLKQESPSCVDKQTEQLKTDVPTKPPTTTEIISPIPKQLAKNGPTETVPHKAPPTDSPESDDDFSLTETESLMSSITGLESTKPPTPEVSAASSQLSLTTTDDTLTASIEPMLERSGHGGPREGSGPCDDSEDVEEEIEEVLSEDEEDTMFEDPLHQSLGSDDVLSDLSEHSSDELLLSHPTLKPADLPPPSPSHDQMSEDDWSEITPSVTDQADSNPITLNTLTGATNSIDNSSPFPRPTISITVESFTLEADSSLEDDSRACNLFVEYQFLDFDFGELETPTSLPKPAQGESIAFNFEKVFQLSSHQLDLLADMLKPGDPSEGRVVFTVVADPEEQEGDCVEVGTAELDLNKILQNGQDLHSECIDVVSCDDAETDAETVGFLSVTVLALQTLQILNSH